MAHCLGFKMLILHLNDLQTTAYSCSAKWSRGTANAYRQRLLDSIAGTITMKIYLQSHWSKFKSFSIALMSLKKQKSWFHLVGILSVISVRPVYLSMNMKNLITLLHITHPSSWLGSCNLQAIVCLVPEYLSGLGFLFSCCCLYVLQMDVVNICFYFKSQDCYYFLTYKLLNNEKCWFSLILYWIPVLPTKKNFYGWSWISKRNIYEDNYEEGKI